MVAILSSCGVCCAAACGRRVVTAVNVKDAATLPTIEDRGEWIEYTLLDTVRCGIKTTIRISPCAVTKGICSSVLLLLPITVVVVVVMPVAKTAVFFWVEVM